MPLLKRVRVLGAKIEATPGTAETITNAEAAFNVFDVECQSTMTVTERVQQGGFGMLLSAVEGHGGTCSFKLNPYGDGAGGVPAWASTFLPACGMVDTAGVFSPVAEAPGANVKTLTIAVYENGIVKTLVGAAGDMTLNFPTGKLSEMEFTFTGVWKTPTDGTILAPTYPSILPFRSTGTFTLGSWTPCFETLSVALGNNVILRECQDDVSGYKSAAITERKPVITVNPEASLVAVDDHYDDWIDSVSKAMNYAITDGTDSLTFNAPAVQYTNVQEGDRNGIQTDDLEGMILNDDFSLDFT